MKFGNPDGEGTSRVGIGLPNFFINKEYQSYVLPIVLFIILVLVPQQDAINLNKVTSISLMMERHKHFILLTLKQE